MLLHIPARWEVRIRYYGAASSTARRGAATQAAPSPSDTTSSTFATPRRRTWAKLIGRVFGCDPLRCKHCGGRMRVISFISDPEVIGKIPRHLGRWHQGPRGPPARATGEFSVVYDEPTGGKGPTLWFMEIADGSGGGVSCGSGSSPTLTNCIVWGNEPESLCGNASHCLTDQDPLFVDNGVFDFDRFVTVDIGGVPHEVPDFVVEAPDYHLQPGSPAIDAGTPAGAPETDIEGNPRPCHDAVDIGAYEYCGLPIQLPTPH